MPLANRWGAYPKTPPGSTGWVNQVERLKASRTLLIFHRFPTPVAPNLFLRFSHHRHLSFNGGHGRRALLVGRLGFTLFDNHREFAASKYLHKVSLINSWVKVNYVAFFEAVSLPAMVQSWQTNLIDVNVQPVFMEFMREKAFSASGKFGGQSDRPKLGIMVQRDRRKWMGGFRKPIIPHCSGHPSYYWENHNAPSDGECADRDPNKHGLRF